MNEDINIIQQMGSFTMQCKSKSRERWHSRKSRAAKSCKDDIQSGGSEPGQKASVAELSGVLCNIF